MSDITSARLPAKKPDHAALSDLASGQAGYFTAHQADGAGFTRGLLAYHTKAGRFVRIRRGLYRLPEYPRSSNEQVITAWLSVGKDSTVVSHHSALFLLALANTPPDVVHLTVPRSRRNLPSIQGVKIHTTVRPVAPGEIVHQDGIPVTAAVRSILDSAESGVSQKTLEQAVARALRGGHTTGPDLAGAARVRGRRAAEIIDRAITAATGRPRRRPSGTAARSSARQEEALNPSNGERMAELMKHLSTLPAADQELLTLHFEHEVPIGRIAGMKNMAPDAVRDRILRSLVTLRARIKNR